MSSAPLGYLEDSVMTLIFIALLGLGLHQGLCNQVQAGVPPKPSIWADPGPRVRHGIPVTIWCQGSLQADDYILYYEKGSAPLEKIPQASSNKTGFFIRYMSSYYAGVYQCAYITGDMPSEWSDALLLVVTGLYNAPSLSAHPGPVVASGGNVSLLCSSQSTWDTFYLLKEGGVEQPQCKELERNYHPGRWQAVFPVGPMNTSHGGTYRCYSSSSHNPNVWSQPSAPLHLEVTGVYREPSLSAKPGPLLLPGDSLTLQCLSEPGFDRYALTKDEGPTPLQNLHGQHSPDFPRGPLNFAHGGRYRCYSAHNISHVWSAPSAPLDILITGKYRKPSLSAQPGPSVPWGANVTLQCGSEFWADTFHLHREGSLDPPQQLHLQDMATPSQANFTISPVTWGHNGTYRCYSSHSSSPFQLSQPSDPLELLVSAQGLQWYWNILIGVSVVLTLLFFLILFLLPRLWHQSKGRTLGATDLEPKNRGLHTRSNPAEDAQEEPLCERKGQLPWGGDTRISGSYGGGDSLEGCGVKGQRDWNPHSPTQLPASTLDAAVKDPQPGEGMELDPQQNRTHDDSQGETYTQVTLSTSKLRQGMASSPSPLSEELLDMKDRQAEEDTHMDSQAAASAAPQDVTYAQLTHLAIRQEASAPSSSPSEEPPDESSVYAALAVH